MIRSLANIVLFTICSLALSQSFGQEEFTSSNLPIIIINTEGQKIVDEEKITCNMEIIWNESGHRNFIHDPANEYNGKIGIEIRGSTSQKYPKKSYGMETRDFCGDNLNTELLGLPKENDWILYGIYSDKSLMRNAIAYSLYTEMQPWAPKYVYCELVIDDEYQGLYMLIEKIKRDNDRLDVAEFDKTDTIPGGFIFKIDKSNGNNNVSWDSQTQDGLQFLYHDPKYEELSVDHRNYLKDYITDFENAIYSEHFTSTDSGYQAFIDAESFIDFMIMQEFGKTVDGYRSSSFMYKDAKGKLNCGPIWDFNLSFGNADYCGGFSTEGWQYNFESVCGLFYKSEIPQWWGRLLEDPWFANKLQCRWQYLRSTILSTANVDRMIDDLAIHVEEAKDRNFAKWDILGKYVRWNPFVGETHYQEIMYLKWWIRSRSEFLDLNFPGVCTESEPESVFLQNSK